MSILWFGLFFSFLVYQKGGKRIYTVQQGWVNVALQASLSGPWDSHQGTHPSLALPHTLLYWFCLTGVCPRPVIIPLACLGWRRREIHGCRNRNLWILQGSNVIYCAKARVASVASLTFRLWSLRQSACSPQKFTCGWSQPLFPRASMQHL